LVWNSYSGNFNYDPKWFSSASLKNGNNGVSTGSSLNFSCLASATNNNFIDSNNNNGQINFSIQFLGYFYTQNYNGIWTFATSSDDASYLWIGNVATTGYTIANALVGNSGVQGTSKISATISLNANTYYPIRIQYSQVDGPSILIVTITPPGGTSFKYGYGYFYHST
jgi:hypothetical protein